MQQIDNSAFCKAVEKAHEVGWMVSDDDALSFLMSASTKTGEERSLEEIMITGFYIIAKGYKGF